MNHHVMDYYYDLFKRNWKTITTAAVTGIAAGTGFSAFLIFLIHRQLGLDAQPEPYLGLLFVLAVIGYFVLASLSEYLLLSLSQQELYTLRLRFIRQVLSLPLKRIEEIGGADLMASLTEDVERIAASLRKLATLFLNGAMVLGAGFYLAWLSWKLLLVLVLLMAGGLLIYRMPLYQLGLLDKYWERLRDGWDRLLNNFHALTHGTKELLIHRERRENFFLESVQPTARRLRDDAIRGNTIRNLFFRAGDVLYLAVLGLMLFVLPSIMTIEQHVLMGYVMAGLFVLTPMASLINFGPDFGDALVAVRRVKRLGVSLVGEPEHELGKSGSLDQEVWAGQSSTAPLLRLEGVTYRYRRELDDEEFVLGPLTLDLYQGEITFITGGNGSGKTTLLKLVCGLYQPEEGRIFWKGVEVTDQNREAFRQHFSVVFYDFYLFETLVGLKSPTMDGRADAYLERLHLHKKVSFNNGKLSTLELSQGQRKRLALLTAYMEDRPVYMFDEWAADQDPLFREVFYREILRELKASGKTLLVITHDDSWYGQADRVVKLQGGQVVADETHVLR